MGGMPGGDMGGMPGGDMGGKMPPGGDMGGMPGGDMGGMPGGDMAVCRWGNARRRYGWYDASRQRRVGGMMPPAAIWVVCPAVIWAV